LQVCGIAYNNRRGLQLGQLIEQGSSSRGPGGAGFQLGEPMHQQGTAQGGSACAQAIGGGLQLGGRFGGHLQRKGGHGLPGAAAIGDQEGGGVWGGQRGYAGHPSS
jgi:hypothetical protein